MATSKIRLDKLISSQTSYSRRDIQRLAKSGEILVNNQICRSADTKVDPASDEVEVCNEKIVYKQFVYYMMNKPKGVLSASNDKNALTVVDILPDELYRKNLFPSGRLDKDTTGLIIITDDGDFAHKMLSPSKKVYKHYIATLEKPLTDDVKLKFESGIVLNDGTVCKKAYLDIIDDRKALVKICEGKFHQVKKMFSACDNCVTELKRVQIGQLRLDESLMPGQARIMTEDEKLSVFGTI